MIKELILNAGREETRAALLEDGLAAELFLERASAPNLLGNIYKARVSNVLPGMQSAFVDIGLDRDAFLYVTDLLPLSAEPVQPRDDAPRAHERGPGVESLLSPGQELLVQVIKEPMGGKGARVTGQISVPGRSLVYVAGGSGRGASRRIRPDQERERLRRLAEQIAGEGSLIVRTAGAGASLADLEEEARLLRGRWDEIRRSSESASAPSCLHREDDLVLRVLRDLFTQDIHRVVVDDDQALRRCQEFARVCAPSLAPRLEKFGGSEPIFEAFGVEREIQRALRRRVWLPSGGYLVIHPTEALVAIDVNTGKFVGSTRFEETALITNLEAAREVVRQIRLRDLGGILVIDFIDLAEEESRIALARTLERELESDRARSRVLQISEFGLVEITRQRIRQGIESLLCGPCPECRGSGRLRTAETLRFQIQRELRKSTALAPEGRWVVRAHPMVVAEIEKSWGAFLEASGASAGAEVRVDAVPGLHVEEFEIRTS